MLTLAFLRARAPQQIEETLKRISQQKGVEGYIIADEVGNVLRTTFTDEPDREMVAKLSQDLPALATRASSAVRDLDPTVRAAPPTRACARRFSWAVTDRERSNSHASCKPSPPCRVTAWPAHAAECDALCSRADKEKGADDF